LDAKMVDTGAELLVARLSSGAAEPVGALPVEFFLPEPALARVPLAAAGAAGAVPLRLPLPLLLERVGLGFEASAFDADGVTVR